MSNLLVELGTEELPVGILDVVYNDLKPKAEEALRKARLAFDAIKVEATPRRISLYIEGVATRQEDESLELSGPSFEKAYQPDGQPTQALEGFLRGKGASLKDVQLKETPKGKFVVVHQKNIGKPAAAVLPKILQEIFSSLSFPKNMRWEKTGFRFPRPLRWVVAILDKKVLNFSFASLKASNKTYGHRFLAPKAFIIPSADWQIYQKLLRKAHVVLDLAARKKMIASELETKYKQAHYDEELLHTTAQLAEEPFLFQGGFSKDYLELFKEVLASCMKKNQKIFACYDSKGYLTGKFVAVLNGKRSGLDQIRKGYENVLDSRLKDARYFFKADTKEHFESKLNLLEQVTYLGKLGNMLQKTDRMEKLSDKFSKLIGRDDLKQDLRRTARLSKIDLMTHLVYEFPDLQGITGREYALAAGERPEVAGAIGVQYLPKNLGQDYREVKKEISPLGAMFGLIDRMDLLAGAFGTGLEPSGSQDPFALRRAGGSVIKLIRAYGFHFSMEELVKGTASLFPKLDLKPEEIWVKMRKFFEDRVIFEMQVKPGSRQSEILQAVMRASFDDAADVFERYEVLSKLFERDADSFLKAAKVVERTGNILKGLKGASVGDVNPGLLENPLEKELNRLCEQRSGEISELLKRRDYEQATLAFGATFYKALNDFFSQVMVNVEDTAIRANRHALMKRINRLYTERLADLSLLSRLDQV